MKIYLAARYSRHPELQGYAAELEALGHDITSRWIQGGHQISDAGLSEEASGAERQRFATEDWEDLEAADLVISFTEEPRSTNSRGGRHVEFGAALGMGRCCLVVGPRENVFHCLPEVLHYPDWGSCQAHFFERLALLPRQWGDVTIERGQADTWWFGYTDQIYGRSWDAVPIEGYSDRFLVASRAYVHPAMARGFVAHPGGEPAVELVRLKVRDDAPASFSSWLRQSLETMPVPDGL